MGTVYCIPRERIMQIEELKRGDNIYFARILESIGVYDLCELKIRMVCDNWFSGFDKRDKRVYLFNENDINQKVFKNRNQALNKIREMEKRRTKKVFTIEECE